jgi:hypothetical protein
MLDSDPYRNSRQIRKTGIARKETEGFFWGEKVHLKEGEDDIKENIHTVQYRKTRSMQFKHRCLQFHCRHVQYIYGDWAINRSMRGNGTR